MSKREECEGCDFYDPYPCACMCKHYDDFVERITYCEHRTMKGKRINDASNPLIMKRLLRWCEVWHQGRVRGTYNSFYNPDGIHRSQADHINDEGIYCDD